MDNDLLRTFVTIVETGSFNRAADILHKSQAALSLQIKRLESDLGVALLVRSTKGIYPTEAGRELLPYAIESLMLSDNMRRLMDGRKTSMTLRVGLLEDIVVGALPRVIERFIKCNTNIKIEINVSDSKHLSRLLKEDQLELVIADQSQVDASPRLGWQERLEWFCSAHYRLPTAAPLPIVAFGRGCPWQARALAALDAQGIPWEIVLNSSNLSAINSAVEAGIGISFGLHYSITHNAVRILEPRDGVADIEPVELGVYLSDKRQVSPQLDDLFDVVCRELIDSRATRETTAALPVLNRAL